MRQEVAKLWVDALRSGKYKQGKHVLRTRENSFCCLGVLCEVAINNGCSIKVYNNNFYYLYNGVNGILPDKVMKWAEMNSSTGKYRPNQNENNLTDLNDSGKSFEEIANVIERFYKQL